MRIISGKWKGKRIEAPGNLPVRPTTDMAKEGLFNYLQTRLEWSGLEAMDLFAGTGNITYELLSRGAASVVVVDKHPSCTKFIGNTLRQLGVTQARVFTTDARVAVERSKDQFDFIFADPPYDLAIHHTLSELIMQSRLLKPGGIYAIEHPAEVSLTAINGYTETRHYGRVHFSFFSIPSNA
jgi:16S rRNA (guanine966-N2)-methyltransferase